MLALKHVCEDALVRANIRIRVSGETEKGEREEGKGRKRRGGEETRGDERQALHLQGNDKTQAAALQRQTNRLTATSLRHGKEA